MQSRRNTFIVMGLILAILFVMAYRDNPSARAVEDNQMASVTEPATASNPEAAATEPGNRLPQFVEVGAESCIPCKMMQPILDEMRVQYAGQIEIVMADVWKDPELGRKYNVRSIPTQVIYDGDGVEVFRHVGFWPKDEIDVKLKELGLID